MSNSDFSCGRNTFFFTKVDIAQRFSFSQVPKKCTDLDFILLCILILMLGTYSKFARINHFLALGVCFPQPCSSAGAGLPRQNHVYITTNKFMRFHNDELDEMPFKPDSTEIRVRLRNTQPHRKGYLRSELSREGLLVLNIITH